MNEAASDPSTPAPTQPATPLATSSGKEGRRWRVAVGVILLLAAVVVLAVTLQRVPVYVASALIMIEENPPYVVFSEGSATAGSLRYVETQIELLRSPLVLEVLLADSTIANFPAVEASQDRVAHLQEHLQISRINVSELYNVSYSSSSPEHSRLVANSVVNEYLKIQERSEYDRYQRVVDLLEDERLHRAVVVEELRTRVVNLSKDVTGKDPFELGIVLDDDVANDVIDDLRRELRGAEMTRAVLKAEIEFLRTQSAPASAANPPGVATLVAQDRRAATPLKASLAALQEAPATAEGPQDPPADAPADPAGNGTAPTDAAVDRRLADLEEQLRGSDVKCEFLSNELREQIGSRQAGSSKLVELQFATEELERQAAVLDMIETRKLAMTTESRAPAR